MSGNKTIFFFRIIFCAIFLIANLVLFSNNSVAQNYDQYPNISGKVLFESRSDSVVSSNKSDISKNYSLVNIEPAFSLNINNNWSVKTNWRISPFYDRDNSRPERFREVLSQNRGLQFDKEDLLVEQLKGEFQNDDMKFFFGKFNPAFGTAWKRDKKIGIFTSDFTRDYELREKIGVGGAAVLEKSEISLNGFFNDVSDLSSTALNRRKRESTSDGVAGNTSTLSSYTVAIDGKDFFDVANLTYNFGYSKLAVNNIQNRADQNGYVGGLEYAIPIGINTYLIPYMEVAKINNMAGESDRNALYITTALTGKYNGWTASISRVGRNIRQKNIYGNVRDHQIQATAGYKFRNNISVDITRMNLKEDGYSASLLGVLVSYIYQF